MYRVHKNILYVQHFQSTRTQPPFCFPSLPCLLPQVTVLRLLLRKLIITIFGLAVAVPCAVMVVPLIHHLLIGLMCNLRHPAPTIHPTLTSFSVTIPRPIVRVSVTVNPVISVLALFAVTATISTAAVCDESYGFRALAERQPTRFPLDFDIKASRLVRHGRYQLDFGISSWLVAICRGCVADARVNALARLAEVTSHFIAVADELVTAATA
jgi:hypothetical protein